MEMLCNLMTPLTFQMHPGKNYAAKSIGTNSMLFMLDLVRRQYLNPFPLAAYLGLKILSNTWVLIYQLTPLTTIYSSAKIFQV